ncbi:MAG: hypothetical protein WBP81_00005 [Solirubrobacteraceae bacterium]
MIDQRAAAETVETSLASASEERESVRTRLAEVRAAIGAANATADEFAGFLLSAEEFVQADQCPVCEQPILPDQVRTRLRERAVQIPDSLRSLEQERRALEDGEHRLDEQVARPRVSLAGLRERIVALQDEQRRLEASEAEWQAALASAGLPGDPDPEEVSSQHQVEATRAAQGEQWMNDVDALLARARYLASEDRRSWLADEQQRLHAEQQAVLASAQRAQASRTLLQGVTAAAKESELEIVERLMLEQKPLLNALYQRLRPHPVLDQLDVEFGQFSQRGEVYFEAMAHETRANVSAIFSSAQLNAVAICIFLAINLSAGDARFALLDDPIQNMDDFNVLGLLDLLRSISAGREVVLSTHDAQLGELMRRKLRPLQLTRRTISHEFTGYDALGPQVKTEIDEFSETPEFLPALVA